MRQPTIERYHRRTPLSQIATLASATRPAFLSASVLPVLAAGALAAVPEGADVSMPLLMMAVLAIVLVHAGANVLNDYQDALSGNDATNAAFVYPFSGGSRFIQNGVISPREAQFLGAGLIVAGAVIGLGLVLAAGPWLLVVGGVGLALAVTYSAPPCLACRGLGDLTIIATFGVLPVVGTMLVLTGSAPAAAWWLGAVLGCFAAAILWVNSIPDIPADRAAGKLTLPARIGAFSAEQLLVVWFLLGFAILMIAPLPRATWIALAAAVPAAIAVREAAAGNLLRAMPATIITHAAVGVLLILGLLLAD